MKSIKLAVAAAVGSAAFLAVPLAATPASAATPGSECTLRVLVSGTGSTTIPGTVGSNGYTCVPNTPLTGVFAPLNVGVACGTGVNVALLTVVSECDE
jgi:hypothetical protein